MALRNVMMYPGRTSRRDNPYIHILTQALEQAGVPVNDFRAWSPFGTGGILHIHWFERVFHTRLSSRSPAVASYYADNLIRCAQRVRRASGRIVWTAHNLKPHDRLSGMNLRTWDRLQERLIPLVDTVITMTPGAEAKVRSEFPSLGGASFSVAPHPHYRDFFSTQPTLPDLRVLHGIPRDAKVLTMVGQIRPYKGTLEALRAFREASAPDLWLVLAGKAHPACKEELLSQVRGTPNVTLLDAHLSHAQVAQVYHASDLALFNFKDIFNSGSVLTALSLDVPVFAPRKGTLSEVADEVGRDWLHLFDQDMDAPLLREDVWNFLGQDRSARPMLGNFDPSRVARIHRDIYFASSPVGSRLAE